MYQEEWAIAFLQEFLDEYENAYIAHSRLQQPLFIAVAGYLHSETVHVKSSELLEKHHNVRWRPEYLVIQDPMGYDWLLIVESK